VKRILRGFNEAGLYEVQRRLDQIDIGEKTAVDDLIEDENLTEQVGAGIPIDINARGSRGDMAAALQPVISEARHDLGDISRRRGLWTWLAMTLMDDIAPVVDGSRKLGARARWVLEAEDWKRYYRHLIAGPFFVFDLYSDDPSIVQALLSTPVGKPGEVVEQIASRQDLVRARGVMEALTKLYVRSDGGLKRGASGKDAGSARRFADVIYQFDLTFDIHTLGTDRVLELLPAEFDRFR